MLIKKATTVAIMVALALSLLLSGQTTSLEEPPVLTYTGNYMLISDGYVALELDNHGFNVNAALSVFYTYACDGGPEEHATTVAVHHGELGTIWVAVPLEPPYHPEMCFGDPTINGVTLNVTSYTPLQEQGPNNPPTIEEISLFPITGLAPLDVTATFVGSDADGTVVAWEWDFGDGPPLTGEGGESSILHTYEQPGTYLVFLKIWDDKGAVAYSIGKVRAIGSTPAADGGIIIIGAMIQYRELTLDASGILSNAPPGTSHAWDFGDGSSAEGTIVAHSYDAPGAYVVTVISSLPEGQDIESSIDILIAPNNAPEAALAVSEEEGTFVFDASASADPDKDSLTYAWDFGDGGTATGITAAHSFALPGSYTVTLTISDGYAQASAGTTIVVEASSPPVCAIVIEGDATTGSAMTFDASGSYDPDGDALTYSWDFGDGGTAQGERVEYAYETAGTYTVVLTASDGEQTATAFSTVKVGTDRMRYLIYLVPLLAALLAILIYTIKYGPKNTFEGIDLVRKDV